MKKKILIFSLLFSFIININGCGKQTTQNKISKSSFYFDTLIEITLYDSNETQLIDECFSIAKQYESLLSNTIKSSDISNINTHPFEYIEVNDITIDVLKKALNYCEISDGAFDITIGKVSELWNISEISKSIDNDDHLVDTSYLPSDEEIKNLINDVDYHNIEIKDNQVKLNNSNCKIDLGAIAKGYIADIMKDYLNEKGVRLGIINLGGNILTLGPKDNNQSYTIGIQKPFSMTGETAGTLSIIDSSIVTSGTYERYFKIDDKIYHHILDTNTGYPIENELNSVTIISDSSCDGDALSTLIFTMGLEKGISYIEKLENIDAIFITKENKIYHTSGLDNIFEY